MPSRGPHVGGGGVPRGAEAASSVREPARQPAAGGGAAARRAARGASRAPRRPGGRSVQAGNEERPRAPAVRPVRPGPGARPDARRDRADPLGCRRGARSSGDRAAHPGGCGGRRALPGDRRPAAQPRRLQRRPRLGFRPRRHRRVVRGRRPPDRPRGARPLVAPRSGGRRSRPRPRDGVPDLVADPLGQPSRPRGRGEPRPLGPPLGPGRHRLGPRGVAKAPGPGAREPRRARVRGRPRPPALRQLEPPHQPPRRRPRHDPGRGHVERLPHRHRQPARHAGSSGPS